MENEVLLGSNMENENLHESEPDGFKKCKKLLKDLMCVSAKTEEDRNERQPILRKVEIPSPEIYLIEDKSQDYTSRERKHNNHEPMNNLGVNQMLYRDTVTRSNDFHSTSHLHHFHEKEEETVLRPRGHMPYVQNANITSSPANDGKTSKTSKTENSLHVHIPNNENQLSHALADISKGDDRYDFNHKQRGYAALIINSKFDFQSARRSTDWDTYFMKKMFEGLGFKTILLENLGSNDLMSKLKEIRAMITADCDCFACVISSHGSEGHSTIQGKNEGNILRTEHFINTKDGVVRTQELLDLFNDRHCRNLRRKPKLFFIQACRGRLDIEKDDEVDKGVHLPARDVLSRPGYSSSDSTKPTETTSDTSESKLDPHLTEAKLEETSDKIESTPDPQRRYDDYSGRLPAEYLQSERRHRDRYPPYQNTGIQRLDEMMSLLKDVTVGKNEDPNIIPFIDDNQKECRETRNIPRGTNHVYEGYIYEPWEDPYPTSMYQYTAPFPVEDPLELFEIPCHNDFLVMFSSASGTLSWSDSDKGGWLLYCLYKVFDEIANTEQDLLHILTRVCGKMAVDMKTYCPSTPQYDEAKSAACIYHKLTKDIYLRPPITKI